MLVVDPQVPHGVAADVAVFDAGGDVYPSGMIEALARVGDGGDRAVDDAFNRDGVRVSEADGRLQGVATVCGDRKTAKGLLRKEADLSPGVHDGAGNVNVEGS